MNKGEIIKGAITVGAVATAAILTKNTCFIGNAGPFEAGTLGLHTPDITVRDVYMGVGGRLVADQSVAVGDRTMVPGPKPDGWKSEVNIGSVNYDIGASYDDGVLILAQRVTLEEIAAGRYLYVDTQPFREIRGMRSSGALRVRLGGNELMNETLGD